MSLVKINVSFIQELKHTAVVTEQFVVNAVILLLLLIIIIIMLYYVVFGSAMHW